MLNRIEMFVNHRFKYLAFIIASIIAVVNLTAINFSYITYAIALILLRFVYLTKRRSTGGVVIVILGILYYFFVMDDYTKLVAHTEIPKYMLIIVSINLPLLSYLLHDVTKEVLKYVFNFILYTLGATIYMDIIANIYRDSIYGFGLSDFDALTVFAVYFQLLVIEDMLKLIFLRLEINRVSEDEFLDIDNFI